MFVGESPDIIKIRETVNRITFIQASSVPVLILGETGSGKEEVAKLIHTNSNHQVRGNFIPVNCASFPHDLIESGLFGYCKGAFTGAETTHDGFFHLAHGGTLFLDEIGDLPLPLQSKLLRALENSIINRVGSTKPESIHINRFIFATNQPIQQLVDSNRFRKDLFYRINAFVIDIPPLRERTEDIPRLVDHLLQELDPAGLTQISRATIDALTQYPWPGNVRELKNFLLRCTACKPGKTITPDDLEPLLGIRK
ncbi:MAG: sigma-54-dependent Fis family transcriptional regulator, partial [Candidatus Omnitrophota bacterium]